MSGFWERVETCEHEWSPNYLGRPHDCGQEEVGCFGPSESHCLKCGVYETTDPCGCEAGLSGWPSERWRRKRLKEARG